VEALAEPIFQPAQVARELGISVQQLLHYERQGYVPAARRTVAGDRLYSLEDIRATGAALDAWRATSRKLPSQPRKGA